MQNSNVLEQRLQVSIKTTFVLLQLYRSKHLVDASGDHQQSFVMAN